MISSSECQLTGDFFILLILLGPVCLLKDIGGVCIPSVFLINKCSYSVEDGRNVQCLCFSSQFVCAGKKKDITESLSIKKRDMAWGWHGLKGSMERKRGQM